MSFREKLSISRDSYKTWAGLGFAQVKLGVGSSLINFKCVCVCTHRAGDSEITQKFYTNNSIIISI